MKYITPICFVISAIFGLQTLIIFLDTIYLDTPFDAKSFYDDLVITIFFLAFGIIYQISSKKFYSDKCNCENCTCENCNCGGNKCEDCNCKLK